MSINEKIFKAYDIRGIYPTDLTDDIAYRLGRAFVTFLKADKVIVGYDMRLSSPALRAAVIKGITEQGADVIDIGLATTDMFYYACGSLGLPGLIGTASHNPKEYGGFKMVKKLPELIGGGSGMEEIRDLVVANNFPTAARTGAVIATDIHDGFRDKVLANIDVQKIKPLKIVVDVANGLGGMAFDLVYRNLPIAVTRLYFEPDGNFPNHGGDPLQAENRQDLISQVLSEKADLGFAFDPDADRFFAVDSRGHFVPGDFMTALLGRYLIEKYGAAAVVYDLRASAVVHDLVTAAGGRALPNRIGHAYIKPRMQQEQAIFGGEVTGHYYFRDFYFSDTGMVPSLLLLEMLGHYGQTLSELLAPLEAKYFISGEINSTVADAAAVLTKLKATYQGQYNIQELDGVSIIADTWHANVRKSNTEPLVRLNVEAVGDKALMEQKRDELLALIRA